MNIFASLMTVTLVFTTNLSHASEWLTTLPPLFKTSDPEAVLKTYVTLSEFTLAELLNDIPLDYVRLAKTSEEFRIENTGGERQNLELFGYIEGNGSRFLIRRNHFVQIFLSQEDFIRGYNEKGRPEFFHYKAEVKRNRLEEIIKKSGLKKITPRIEPFFGVDTAFTYSYADEDIAFSFIVEAYLFPKPTVMHEFLWLQDREQFLKKSQQLIDLRTRYFANFTTEQLEHFSAARQKIALGGNIHFQGTHSIGKLTDFTRTFSDNELAALAAYNNAMWPSVHELYEARRQQKRAGKIHEKQ